MKPIVLRISTERIYLKILLITREYQNIKSLSCNLNFTYIMLQETWFSSKTLTSNYHKDHDI